MQPAPQPISRVRLKDKVLIANRGEIALRIMEACKDLGLDYTVIYTAADEESEHVRRCLDSQSNVRRAWRVSAYTDPNDILSTAIKNLYKKCF